MIWHCLRSTNDHIVIIFKKNPSYSESTKETEETGRPPEKQSSVFFPGKTILVAHTAGQTG